MKKFANWYFAVCMVIMLTVSAVLYPSLPDMIPSHWNVQGQPDDYMPKLIGVLLLPLLCAAIWLGLSVLPKIDPRRESYARFEGTYIRFMMALVTFFTFIHVMVMFSAASGDLIGSNIIMVGVGILLAFIGNELPRVPPTYFVGIRTPWTLADDRVWRKTHRVGGRMFFAGGVMIALAALFLPMSAVVPLLLVIVFGLSFGLMAYSYWIFSRGTI